MSKSNDRRAHGHVARRHAYKKGQRRAYGRRRIPMYEIEDPQKESRARANSMGPTVEEGLDDMAGGCLGTCDHCMPPEKKE